MHDGGGGGDIFDGMTHQQMLQWLDQADSSTIQAAADKLTTAARTIHKIAADLKVRPQYVSWKGDGAEAFRAWGDDLANSTVRLGDFSAGSAQWLARAGEAISTAQVSIPREEPGTGNSDGTGGSSGKPGGSGTKSAAKAAADAAKLAADKEAVRQEAAGQMRKLGQSYQLAATQMNALERPVFPPVPEAVVPIGGGDLEDQQDLTRPGSPPGSGSAAGSVVRQHGSVSDNIAASHTRAELSAKPQAMGKVAQIRTDLDSADVLPKAPNQAPSLPDATTRPEVPPLAGRIDPGPQFPPPPLGQGPGKPLPTARGQVPSASPATGGRVPPRQVVGGVPQRDTTSKTPMGKTPMGRATQNPTRGIVGGRPSQTPTGRAATGIPRSPVVGGKGTGKSTPSAGRTEGTARTPAPRPGSPSSQKPGRAKAIPSRGEAPARGLPPQTTGGVIGANTAKRERSGRLPSGTSAPSRGGIAGGVPSKESRTSAHNADTPVQHDAGKSAQGSEQRQSQQPKKPKQPQRSVTAEPQKKNRPQAD